jgi:uncharacterized membrane protein
MSPRTDEEPHLRRYARYLLIAAFTAGGLGHFFATDFFVEIMPPYLPWHQQLVWFSGGCELLGACGLALPHWRCRAGVGLMLLTLAVFPANIHMAIHAEQYSVFPLWALYARLPLQVVVLAWIWWAAVRTPRTISTR